MAWGGKRKGAGRKFTGINTVTISFSVHKDFAEIIRAMVSAKVKELKAAAKGLPLPKDYVEIKNITAVNPAGASTQIISQNVRPKDNQKPTPKKESDYLKQRRQAKLGVKK